MFLKKKEIIKNGVFPQLMEHSFQTDNIYTHYIFIVMSAVLME